MIIYLTSFQVISFDQILIKRFGGLPGIRNQSLLESALDAPKATFSAEELYPSISEKAAIYLYHISKNHPFNDGNKRAAFVASLTFLKLNQLDPCFAVEDLEQLVVDVANGVVDKETTLKFFQGLL